MKKIASVLMMSLALFSIQTVSTNAATSKLSLTVLQTPGGDEPVVTLYGNLKPAKSSVKVEIQIQLNGKWQDTRFSTRTARVGTWKVVAVATALNAQVKYRAKVRVGSKSIYSNIREITVRSVPEISNAVTNVMVDQLGPGGRIHGSDVSRWQHPNDAPIDFVKKYSAGMRFVMIKASDTRDEADALALKYVIMDRAAAQAAADVRHPGRRTAVGAARRRAGDQQRRAHVPGADALGAAVPARRVRRAGPAPARPHRRANPGSRVYHRGAVCPTVRQRHRAAPLWS